MDKRIIDRMYADKKAYVEKDLAAVLQPLDDFDSIQYARDAITNEEYVKLTESIGVAWFINVTGFEKRDILKAVCKMVLEDHPEGLIRTRERKRDANRLFKGEQA